MSKSDFNLHNTLISDPDPLLGSDSFIEPNNSNDNIASTTFDELPPPETLIEPPQPQPSISPNGGEPSDQQTTIRGRRIRSSAEVSSTESLSWLPPSWLVEDRVRSSGASAGQVDKYYIEPVSGRRFRSKKDVLLYLETGSLRSKRKTADQNDSDTKLLEGPKSSKLKAKVPAFKFDFLNVPERTEWVLTDANKDIWSPFLGAKKVPDHEKRQWEAAFASVTTKGHGNKMS